MSPLILFAMLTALPAEKPSEDHDADWAKEIEDSSRARRKARQDDELTRLPPSAPPVPLATDERLKRFLGALGGGAAGMLAPLLILPLADQSCALSSGIGGGCFTFGHGIAGFLSLSLSLTGALVGVEAVGGRTSFGAAALGSLIGQFLGLGLLVVSSGFSSLPGAGPRTATIIAAGALVVAGQAFAVLLREDDLAERPTLQTPAKRFGLTSLAFMASLAGGVLLATGGAAVSPGSGLLAAAVGLVSAALIPVAAWGAHTANGGRGSLLAAYLGTLATLAVGAAGAGLAVLAINAGGFPADPERQRVLGAALSGAIVGGAILATFGVPLVLEWSHRHAELDEEARPQLRIQVGGAPVPGGAMGLIGARF
jgi:MFS family permease